METNDYNDIFVFDLPSSIRSYVKVVGVGHYGSTIVSIMSMMGLPEVDFAIVENNPIPMKCRMIDENGIVDSNDPECEKKVCEIVGRDTTMLFIVSGLEDDYCEPIITSMCHLVHSYEEGNDDIVSLALIAPSRGEKVKKSIDTIAQEATKIITFYRDNTHHNLLPNLDEDEQQIIDVIQTICQLFLNHQYCCVDYSDVATVLHMGNNAVYGVGEGGGDMRAEKAIRKLIHDFKSKGCKMANVKGMLLYIRFSPTHQPTVEECNFLIDMIYHLKGNECELIYNACDDNQFEGDTLALNAVAVY